MAGAARKSALTGETRTRARALRGGRSTTLEVYLEMRRVCYYSPLSPGGLASVARPLVLNGRDVGF